MTLMLDLTPDVNAAIREAARRKGRTPEQEASDALRSFYVTEAGGHFLAAAEATRHVWDTPEEDAVWDHLQ